MGKIKPFPTYNISLADLSIDTFRQEFVAEKHFCPNCGAKMDGERKDNNEKPV